MIEPSQGQPPVANGHNHARAQGSITANGAARNGNGAARRPAEPPPLDAVDLFSDLAAACVPAFCDALHFDLAAEGESVLRVSFPPAPDGAPSVEGAASADVADGLASAADGGRPHAQQSTRPGQTVITVHVEPSAAVAPVVGTITCTWHDLTRPTEADALVVRLLADQAAAKLHLKSLDFALQKQLTRAANLEEALATNREIGQAIGILMATDHVTAEQAFEKLRTASQHTHRKLRDIAADVAETGALAPPPELARAQADNRQSPEGRAERRTDGAHRVQRRTRGGQPVAADES